MVEGGPTDYKIIQIVFRGEECGTDVKGSLLLSKATTWNNALIKIKICKK